MGRQEVHRQTITDKSECMDARIKNEVAVLHSDGWEWVSVSDSMPVVMDDGRYTGVDCSALYYTVTITAGNMI